MTQGQTVYVQWYGKLLQGTVVANTTPDDPLLGSMVAVTITIQGTTATALFTPAHVNQSEEQSTTTSEQESLPTPKPPHATVPDGFPSGDSPSDRLQQFKADHWDHDHNHLRIDALDQFYALWREAASASTCPIPAAKPSPRYIVGIDLAAETEPPHPSPVPSVATPSQPPKPKRITATQLPLLFQ